MTPELWKKVCEVLTAVERLDGTPRAAELDRLRASEPAVVAEVESLLAQQNGQQPFPLDNVLAGAWDRVGESTPPTPELVTRPVDPDALPPTVPGYVLKGGKDNVKFGGMGVVYFGKESALGDRPVAVKVLRQRLAREPEQVAWFEAEARVCALLQHPGIVPVYHVGRLADQRPYYAMKLVRGKTLADRLKERASPASDLTQFLGYFRLVCEAVAYAHGRDVVHRDLKPLNVMIGAFGEVQVMDWGLAKVLGGKSLPESESRAVGPDRGTDDVQTPTKGARGTPEYMPPEQATGSADDVDKRSDVFALGGILCTILTGSPPYRGATRRAVEDKALNADLGDAHNRLRACRADPDLGALALRCLSADRNARPADGEAIAKAITDYLAGLEKRAQDAEKEKAAAEARAAEEANTRREAEARAAEEQKRLAVERQKRQRTLFLSAVAFVILVTGTAVSGYFAHESGQRAEKESLARKDAETSEKNAKDSATAATKAKTEAEKQKALADTNAQKANESARQEKAAHLEAVRQRVAADMVILEDCWTSNRLDAVEHLLAKQLELRKAEPIERNLEHAYWENQVTAWLFEKYTPKDAFPCAAWSPDGKTVALAADENRIALVDAFTGEQRAASRNLPDPVAALAYNRQGSVIGVATAKHQCFIYDVATSELSLLAGSEEEKDWTELQGRITEIAKAREGDNWEPQATRATEAYRERLLSRNLAFSPDGTMLARARINGAVRLWDVKSKQPIKDCAFGSDVARKQYPPVTVQVSFHPLGKAVAAVASDGLVQSWALPSGQSLLPQRQRTEGPTPSVSGVYSPDGQKYLVGHQQNGVTIYNASTWAVLQKRTDVQNITSAAWSPDQQWVLTGDADGVIRIYAAPDWKWIREIKGLWGPVLVTSPSSDNTRILAVQRSGAVRVWDATNAQGTVRLLEPSRFAARRVRFSPAGSSYIAAGSFGGSIAVWDKYSHRLLYSRDAHIGVVQQMCFDPSGERLATAGVDGLVKVWRARDGERQHVLKGHKGVVGGVAFDPVGKTIATADSNGAVIIWDASSGKQIHTIQLDADTTKLHIGGYTGGFAGSATNEQPWMWATFSDGYSGFVAYSPDGRYLITGREQLSLYNTQSWKLDRPLGGDGIEYWRAHYDQAGALLFGQHFNGIIKVWDAATLDKKQTVEQSPITSAFYAPGSPATVANRLLCLTHEPPLSRSTSLPSSSAIVLWDLFAKRQILRIPIHASGEGYDVAVDPDGSTLAAVGFFQGIQLWDLREQTPATRRSRLESLQRQWPLWHLIRAENAVRSKDLATAIFHVRQHMAKGAPAPAPDKADSLGGQFAIFLKAIRMMEEGRQDDAIALLRQIPKDADFVGAAIEEHALRAQSPDQLEGAVRWLRVGTTARSDNPDLHNALGLVCLKLNRYEEATNVLLAATKLAPRHATAHTNLGYAYAETGEYPNAIRHLEAAIENNQQSLNARLILGRALIAIGDLGSAVSVYEAAAKLAPGNTQARSQLGFVLQELGRLDDARTVLGALLGQTPETDPQFRSRKDALEGVQALIDLEPRLQDIAAGKVKPKNYSEAFRFARLCRVKQYTAAAFKLYDDAITADPKSFKSVAPRSLVTIAGVALLAASGEGNDPLPAAARPVYRAKALVYLREYLKGRQEEAARDPGAGYKFQQDVRLLLHHRSLDSVRPPLLKDFPAAERKEWEAFWANVQELLDRAEVPLKPREVAPPPRPVE